MKSNEKLNGKNQFEETVDYSSGQYDVINSKVEVL